MISSQSDLVNIYSSAYNLIRSFILPEAVCIALGYCSSGVRIFEHNFLNDLSPSVATRPLEMVHKVFVPILSSKLLFLGAVSGGRLVIIVGFVVVIRRTVMRRSFGPPSVLGVMSLVWRTERFW